MPIRYNDSERQVNPMTRDSEKAIASLQKYIDSLGDDIQSEEDLNDVLQEFMQKKLYMKKLEENAEKEAEIRGEVMENGFGSQIRSYVLQPYTMVKDLRDGQESGNAQKVLDGDIDPFLRAYLRWISLGKPKWKGADVE